MLLHTVQFPSLFITSVVYVERVAREIATDFGAMDSVTLFILSNLNEKYKNVIYFSTPNSLLMNILKKEPFYCCVALAAAFRWC
jgi:hypothetical protein